MVDLAQQSEASDSTRLALATSTQQIMNRYMAEVKSNDLLSQEEVRAITREAYSYKYQMLEVLAAFPPVSLALVEACEKKIGTRYDGLKSKIEAWGEQTLFSRDGLFEMNVAHGKGYAAPLQDKAVFHGAIATLRTRLDAFYSADEHSRHSREGRERKQVRQTYLNIVLKPQEFDLHCELFTELTDPIVAFAKEMERYFDADKVSLGRELFGKNTLDRFVKISNLDNRTLLCHRMQEILEGLDLAGIGFAECLRLREHYEALRSARLETLKPIIERNLAFAAKQTRKMNFREDQFFDALQCANDGLIQAAHQYAYWKRFTFTTYATKWVNQRLLAFRARELNGVVTVPTEIVDLRKKINESERKGPRSSVELADTLGANLQEVDRATQVYATFGEIDEWSCGVSDDDGGTTLEQDTLRTVVREAIASLPSNLHQDVCLRRWGFDRDPETIEELASEFGLSEERIRIIEHEARDALKFGRFGQALAELND